MPAWLNSLRDLIAEASPLRRFMFALLLVLPLAALAAAYLWLNPTPYRVLYAQLSDRAGGEVLADEAGEGVEVGVGGGVHQPVSRMRMASASRV